MSGARPVLLLLSGSRRVVDKARALGLHVVHLQAPSTADPDLADLCLDTLEADFTDVPGTVRQARDLHVRHRFVGVVSNHEPACAAAEAAALALGLPAAGRGVTALLRDKVRARRAWQRVPALRTPWAEVASAHDVAAFGAAAGYPLVLKPRDGSASLGVLRVDAPEQVPAAWARAEEALGNRHRYHEVLPVTGYLAERFVTGAEYSVETFTRGGRHEVCAVVAKTVGPGFVETGHVVPAPLPRDDRAAVHGAVLAALDAAGLREGPAHTEVIVGDHGVHVVESHARTGGDGIPALVRLVTGVDVETAMIAHLCGLPAPAPVPPVAAAAAKTYLMPDRTGRVLDVRGTDAARHAPGVHQAHVWVGPGDHVHPAGASWDRLGEVVALGTCPDAARAAARHALGLLSVHVEPPGAPTGRPGDHAPGADLGPDPDLTDPVPGRVMA